MLNIKFIKNNVEYVINNLNQRGIDYTNQINTVLKLYSEITNIIKLSEKLKYQQNITSRKIPEIKKNKNFDIKTLLNDMKQLSFKIKSYNEQLNKLNLELKNILLMIPNIIDKNVPYGINSNENIFIKKYKEPTKFDFEPKSHWKIGENLKMLDPVVAAKITGSRFCVYKNLLAKLERAIINFYLDTHSESGYTEILAPFIANKDSMITTGQIPKFLSDMFEIKNTNLFLIPTAEVTVTNLHRNEILYENKKYCSYSACFRAEAGSAGKDTKGLIRQHQFNKVELVKFVDPSESYEELQLLINDVEKVLQKIDLPYRIVKLCTGDLGFSSACTYDIEVWMPSYKKYVEISSCSNFENYQSHRGNIKIKTKDGNIKFAHTLNGSGVAIGRTVAAIMENYQNKNGEIIIPNVLRKYMNDLAIIKIN